MNLTQMLTIAVVPALDKLAVAKPTINQGSSYRQVLGTGLVESNYAYLRQYPSGPAIGFWEMEEDTYASLWANYLAYEPSLAIILRSIAGIPTGVPDPLTMAWNLQFGAAMCRIKYFDDDTALPPLQAVAMATFHKNVYNTSEGAANIETNTPLFQQAIGA